MKKFFAAKMISLVLVLVLVVSLTACGGSGSGLAGTYKLESIEDSGVSVKVDEYIEQLSAIMGEDVEFDMTLTIKDNGNFTMSINVMGEKESGEGTWTQNGDKLQLTVDGETETATYKDGKISMNFEGTQVVFAK